MPGFARPNTSGKGKAFPYQVFEMFFLKFNAGSIKPDKKESKSFFTEKPICDFLAGKVRE